MSEMSGDSQTIIDHQADEDLESLFKTAKELIDEITSAQKRMEDEDNTMMITTPDQADNNTNMAEEYDDQEDQERLLEFERKYFPYLTKENLLLLLKTYKKIVAVVNQKKKRRSRANEIEINLERRLSLDDSEEAKSEMLYSGIKRIFSRSSSQTNLAKEADAEVNTSIESNRDEDDEDLAKHLIVTNLPVELFSDSNLRTQFETLILSLDARSKLFYFKPLRRCQIECEDFISALIIKFELDDYFFFNANLKIFVTKPIVIKNSRPFLEPPKNEKTFLISPPASPPVGWEQEFEEPPVVNYELIAAIAKLNPRNSHHTFSLFIYLTYCFIYCQMNHAS